MLSGCEDAAPRRFDRAELLKPETCAECHAEHYREWSGSMHAYASEDPVFIAMNQRGQRETGGQLGDFCVKCHAPMAVREEATVDGLNLAEVAPELKGVTCYFCHSVSSVEGTHNNPLATADDGVMRGPFSDAVGNGVHASAYSSLHDRDDVSSAALCGACHDIETEHGARIERTYTEWQESVFSSVPGGATCGQCHMPQSETLQPVASAPGVFARRKHAHSFPGVDVALTEFPEKEAQLREVEEALATTLQSALCVGPAFSPRIQVILDNVAAGHSWPSGATQDRRAWVEVVAESGGQVVYQSGVVQEGVPAIDVWKGDPDMWLMRDCIFDGAGDETHMFWEAAEVEPNALPTKATFDQLDPRFYQTHVFRRFPKEERLMAMPDRVTARVKIRPIGLDIVDDLIASGDLDPSIRDAIPTFDVGGTETLVWTAETANATYFEQGFPVSCFTSTNLDVVADKYPAVEQIRCER